MKTKVPELITDEDAEAFLEQDLSDLDFSQFRPAGFEFQAKTERINMRLPAPRLAAIKKTAAAQGVPYQRYIRQVLESAVGARR